MTTFSFVPLQYLVHVIFYITSHSAMQFLVCFLLFNCVLFICTDLGTKEIFVGWIFPSFLPPTYYLTNTLLEHNLFLNWKGKFIIWNPSLSSTLCSVIVFVVEMTWKLESKAWVLPFAGQACTNYLTILSFSFLSCKTGVKTPNLPDCCKY